MEQFKNDNINQYQYVNGKSLLTSLRAAVHPQYSQREHIVCTSVL